MESTEDFHVAKAVTTHGDKKPKVPPDLFPKGGESLRSPEVIKETEDSSVAVKVSTDDPDIIRNSINGCSFSTEEGDSSKRILELDKVRGMFRSRFERSEP